MKIMIFVHCFYPSHIYGTEAYTLSLAKNLLAMGHQVCVVSSNFRGETPQEEIIIKYEFDGVPVVSIDQNSLGPNTISKTYFNLEMAPLHRHILLSFQPDLVHVNHLINHTASLLNTCRDLGIRTFGTLTDFFGICLNNKLESATGELCAGPNATKSNCVACYSKDADTDYGDPAFMDPSGNRLREARLAPLKARRDLRSNHWRTQISDIQNRYGVLSDAYEVYRCLIAPSKFLFEAYKRNGLHVPLVHSSFGVDIDRRPKALRPTEKITIGYIGQIAPHKGLHILLEAVSQLDCSRFDLRIWGPEAQDAVYVEGIREKMVGLPAIMEGTFNLERTREILDAIDVLVIPSTWYENSPLILLQALATHTPCVVSDVLGMTEFGEDGISGFAFKRSDPGSLYRVLLNFIDDSDLARRMSLTTSYSKTSSDMVKELAAVYDSFQ